MASPLHPDGAHRHHETSVANRHVRINRAGAGAMLHAEGDAVSMEQMEQILNAHADAEYNTDVAARKAAHGEDANRFPLPRTNRQRRFDALRIIFDKAAGTPDVTARVPVVTIVCTQTELNQAIRQHLGNGDDMVESSSRMRLCETLNGAPVDPADLLVAAVLGQVQRLVVDDAGQPVHLGTRRRLFTGKLREAVLLTGNRCTHPGCELKIGNLHIDHLHAWAKGGRTTLANAGTLCQKHNQDKHDKGFTVHRDHTGWHHHRPDGTEIAPRGT